jgi:hypothetical protein
LTLELAFVEFIEVRNETCDKLVAIVWSFSNYLGRNIRNLKMVIELSRICTKNWFIAIQH